MQKRCFFSSKQEEHEIIKGMKKRINEAVIIKMSEESTQNFLSAMQYPMDKLPEFVTCGGFKIKIVNYINGEKNYFWARVPFLVDESFISFSNEIKMPKEYIPFYLYSSYAEVVSSNLDDKKTLLSQLVGKFYNKNREIGDIDLFYDDKMCGNFHSNVEVLRKKEKVLLANDISGGLANIYMVNNGIDEEMPVEIVRDPNNAKCFIMRNLLKGFDVNVDVLGAPVLMHGNIIGVALKLDKSGGSGVFVDDVLRILTWFNKNSDK